MKYKFVILNPSLFVILSPSYVILSVAKNLLLQLRTGSAKNLAVSHRINFVKNLIRSMCLKPRFFGLGLRMTL